MKTTSLRLPPRFALCVALALASTGCPKKSAHNAPPPDAEPDAGEKEFVQVDLTVDNGHAKSVLGHQVTLPGNTDPAPAIIFVPGGGNVSWRGTRTGNGTEKYRGATHITEQLAAVFSDAGFITLAYDKRTCGPRDDPGCGRYDTTDIDQEGPVALTKDVDAAVAALTQLGERFDGRYILMAHGQGAQVALAAPASSSASALVLVAPIPRRIDRVMEAALYERAADLRTRAKRLGETTEKGAPVMDLAEETKNRAGSIEATFKALDSGKFPEDARLMGATVAFWKGWVALTDDLPGSAEKLAAFPPTILVRGEKDRQFARRDRTRIDVLVEQAKKSGGDTTLILLEGKDHHLMPLDREDTMRIVTSVRDALERERTKHPTEQASDDVG